MSMNFSDIAILSIKGSDYHCIISLISKNESINLMQIADLTEKIEHYKLKVYIKMEKAIIKFGDIEIEKQKFFQYKTHISIKNIDTDNIVVSNKASFGKKRF